VDYRKLNEVTVEDTFPLPNIEDILRKLKEANFFTKLDLTDGFWQLKLSKRSRKKTAFSYGGKVYLWKRMPMGAKNSPATLARVMEKVLGPLVGEVCELYVDDLLIWGKTIHEHNENLGKVLEAFRKWNVKVKPAKCSFGACEVDFLGYKVGRHEIRASEKKVEAVKRMKAPENAQELRRILGMVTYLRGFVRNYASKVNKLRELLRKGHSFVWTQKHDKDFQEIKDEIARRVTLEQPDMEKPFIVTSDASYTGLGGYLSQMDGKKERIIAFCSRSLTAGENRYGPTQLEALGAVFAVNQFRKYIWGRRFTLRTDHTALKKVLTAGGKSRLLERWRYELIDFSFEVEHIKGKNMHIADCLSRAKTDRDKAEKEIAKTISALWLLEEERQERVREVATELVMPIEGEEEIENPVEPEVDVEEIELVKKARFGGERETVDEKEYVGLEREVVRKLSERAKRKVEVKLANRRWKLDGKKKVWTKELSKDEEWKRVPRQAEKVEILHEAHDVGHLGEVRCQELIGRRFFWENMKADISTYCRSCPLCARYNHYTRTRKGELHGIQPKERGDTVGLDLLKIGTTRGKEYVLVITEYITRFVVAVPIKNKASDTVAKAIVRNWVAYFGWPENIITDQGTEFEGVCEDLLHMWKVIHLTTVGYTPRANGVVERFNKTIVEMLSKQLDGKAGIDWRNILPILVFEYNSTRHTTTGETPIFLATGVMPDKIRISEDELPRTSRRQDRGIVEMFEALEKVKRRLKEKEKEYKEAQREKYDFVVFEEGDLVWVRNHPRTNKEKGTVKKLQTKFTGPWEVDERIGTGRYRVVREDEEGRQIDKDTKTEDMRTYIPRPRWMRKYFGRDLPEGRKLARSEESSGGSSESSEEAEVSEEAPRIQEEASKDTEVAEKPQEEIRTKPTRRVSFAPERDLVQVISKKTTETTKETPEESQKKTLEETPEEVTETPEEIRKKKPTGQKGERIEVRFKVGRTYKWFVGTVTSTRNSKQEIHVRWDNGDPSDWIPLTDKEMRQSPYPSTEIVKTPLTK
jgi:hypothetical protein